MNKLKNATCYLCGAMDRVDDGGVEWRREISPKLKDMGLGVLDPCNKPTDFAPEDGNFRDKIIELKKIDPSSTENKKIINIKPGKHKFKKKKYFKKKFYKKKLN